MGNMCVFGGVRRGREVVMGEGVWEGGGGEGVRLEVVIVPTTH